MYFNREIFWQDVTRGDMLNYTHNPDVESLRFDPHPQDYDDVEDMDWPELRAYMERRQTEVTQMVEELGTGDRWTGHLKDLNPYGDLKGSPICTRVGDVGTCVLATFTRVGSVDQSPETMIIVPVTRVDKFHCEQVVGGLANLTDEARKVTLLKWRTRCTPLSAVRWCSRSTPILIWWPIGLLVAVLPTTSGPR